MFGNIASIASMVAMSLGVTARGDTQRYSSSNERITFIHPPKEPLTKRQKRRLKGRKS